MTWKIKAIVDGNGNDLYLGDILKVKDKDGKETTITVQTIAMPNGMLFINGLLADIAGLEKDQEN